jgi:hypothetical protein
MAPDRPGNGDLRLVRGLTSDPCDPWRRVLPVVLGSIIVLGHRRPRVAAGG